MVLLAILFVGVASAAEDIGAATDDVAVDSADYQLSLSDDEITTDGGELETSSDIAISSDVNETSNEKLGVSNEDVLGDDDDFILTPQSFQELGLNSNLISGSYKFEGVFDGDEFFPYFSFDEGCRVDASEATFINMGIILNGDVQINGLTMIASRYVEDEEFGQANGALIYVTNDDNILNGLTVQYAPDQDYDVYGIVFDQANNFQLLNSIINFTGPNYGDYYEYAMKIDNCQGTNLVQGNTIIANLPILAVDYSAGDPGLDTDRVLNTGIRDSSVDVINNKFYANVIGSDNNYPTLDCVMLERCDGVNIIGNTFNETDFITPEGEPNYLNVLDMYYSDNVLVQGNKISVETTGGSENSGTAYPIQLTGPYENVVIDGNDLYAHCGGPALGIFSQNYYGDTEILVQNNNIDITGLPTSNSWGLVSGIELQDTYARVYNNDIKTKSITGYVLDGMNIYGISYAQYLNDNHNYDIEGNTIETEGKYTIYLLKAQDTTVTNNYLVSHYAEGDDTVFIQQQEGNTDVFDNHGRGNFYVSPYGDDSNPGSEEEPLQTIECALENVPAGCKIYLLEGNHYLDHNLEIDKAVSIIGKSPDDTIVSLENGNTINVLDVNFEKIAIENIQFVEMPESEVIHIAGNFNNFNIENCVFNVDGYSGIQMIVEGNGNFNFNNNVFNINVNDNDLSLIDIGGPINAEIHNNIFNSLAAIDNAGEGTVNVNGNYWGTNSFADINNHNLVLENIVIADVTVNATEIMAGESATVTVDFNKLQDSNGAVTTQHELIPDAITVSFDANGQFSESSVPIENGVATTTYTDTTGQNDEIVVSMPKQEIRKEIEVITLGGDVEINVTDTWINYSNDVIAALPVSSGTATIKVNGRTVATPSFNNGRLTYTIQASDISSGVNTVEVSCNGGSGQKTFTAYDYDGVVTAETFFNYFNRSNSNRLCEHVPNGAVLDFQGSFISTSSVSYIMEINKPVNMVSTTKDAYINLNTIAQGMSGENPGDRFTVSYGGSGSNISDISFYNSQLWFYNTHNLTINNMTSIVDGREIGSGVGVVAFRANSSHINVKNSYFSTKDNGGHSNFVLTNAHHINVDNCTIKGEGNVGNLIYLNFYNMEGFENMYLPQILQLVKQGKLEINDHNTFTNCKIYGPETASGICYLYQEQSSGYNVLENNTIVYSGVGVNIGSNGIVKGNNITGGCGISAASGAQVINNNVSGKVTASGSNVITGNRIITTENYAIDLGSSKNNEVHDNYLVSSKGKGDAAINLGSGTGNVVENNGPTGVDIALTVEKTNFWLPNTNTVTVTTDATGAIEIKVNGKTVATQDVDNGEVVYTLTTSDMKAGENTVTAIYQDAEASETFYVYGLVTNETFDDYFDETNSGRIKDWVPEGAVLDFQGKFFSSSDRSFVMEINKPVNIISTTKDVLIDLNTTAGSLMGDNPGNRFTVSNGGSGSNISDLNFHNTQIWVYNAHHVVLDHISNVIEDQRVGSGVGATSIRANSTYVTVKNSYFYTRDNGGSSSLVMAWADYCTFQNNTIEVEGNVGNLIYLTTYNVDIPADTIVNHHNNITDNTVRRLDGQSAAICWGIVIGGPYNLIQNNTIYYAGGTGITGQYGGGSGNGVGNVYIGNKLYNAAMSTLPDAIVSDNYIDGSSLTVAAGSEAYNNTLTTGTLTATDTYVHDNTVNTIVLNGDNSRISGDINNLQVSNNLNISDLSITGTLTFRGSNSIASNVTVNNVIFGESRSNKATNCQLIDSEITGTVTFTQRASEGNSLIGNNLTQTVVLQGVNDIVYQNNIITTNNYAVDATSSRASGNNISDNYLISNGKKGNAAVTYASGKDHIVENNGPDLALDDISDVLMGSDNVIPVTLLPTFRNTTLTVKVNDNVINETEAGGEVNQIVKASDLVLGENTVEVSAYGITKTATFNVFEILIDVTNEITLGDDNSATITIAGETGTVSIKLNGEEIATPELSSGSVTQTISASDIVLGENTVEVTYNGFTNSTTFTAVQNVEINIDVENDEIWLGDENSVTISITGATGTVSIKLNGEEIATPELSSGSVTQTISASDIIAGENTVEVTFNGFTNSTTFTAQGNVVTPENFDKFFSDDGELKDEVPFDELVFKGEFDDAIVEELLITQPLSITGDGAVLSNIRIFISSDDVKLDNLTITADTSVGILIHVEGSNVDLTNLDVSYSADADEAVAIDIQDCNNVNLLNSTIFFESHVIDDTQLSVGIQAVNTGNVVMDRNNITTKLPCVYVMTYDDDYYLMGSNNVNPVRLKDCNNLKFTNNNVNSTTNDYTADFPTIQSIYIIGCSDSLIDHNNISMIDELTPAGMDNYLYGIDFGHNSNVTFSYNNFNMSTSGGLDQHGTAYAFQGVESDVIIRGNNITSISNGPNLGIYVASMFGETSELLIEDNFINVTGSASPSGNWALVSGIEIQNGNAKIYNNTIYTQNVIDFEEGAYIYGISYAQWMYGDRSFDIQNNTIYTEGAYTISVINSTSLYVDGNTLYARELSGDDSIDPGVTADVNIGKNLPPKPDIIIEVDDCLVDEDNRVNITVVGATGNVTIKVNGNVVASEQALVDGTFNYTIAASDIVAGENTIEVIYNGLGKELLPNTNSTTFNVSKLDNAITVDDSLSVDVDDNVDVGASFTDVDSVVTYVIADESVATVDDAGVVTGVKGGSTTLTITVAESGKYKANSTNVSVTVNKLDATITVSDSLSVDVDGTVDVGATSDSDGALSYASNDTSVATVSDAGVVTGVKGGKAKVTVSVPETERYNAQSVDVIVTVNKLDATITVSDSLSVDVDGTVDVGATTDSDGALSYVIADTSVATVSDAGVVTGVKGGSTTLTVSVPETERYNAQSVDVAVTVNKLKEEISINVGEAIIGQDTLVNVSIPGATGNVTVIVDGKKQDIPLENGNANYTIENITAGDHSIVVVYFGDDNNDPAVGTATVSVDKLTPNVSISPIDVKYVGDEIVITVTNDTTVSVTINGKDYTLSEGAITIPNGLAAGEYIVVATAAETDKYHANSDNATFNVVKYASEVNVTVKAGNAGEKSIIEFNVTEGTTGTVVIDVNGTKYTVDVADGKLEVVLDAGSYTIAAAYSGDEKYNASESTAETLVVEAKKAANIDIEITPDDVKVGENITIKITADTDAKLIVTINGEVQEIPSANGPNGMSLINILRTDNNVQLTYAITEAGIYNVTVAAGETPDYTAQTVTKVFEANKKDAVLNITPITAEIGDIITITVENETDGALTIKVNGEEVTGEYEITKAGTYTVVVESAATEAYNKGFATYTFEVAEPENVTVVVDGKEYNATVKNGTITVDTDMDDLIENLTGKVENLTAELGNATEKIADLTGQLSDAQANATKLAEDLADANAKVENLTAELGNATEKIAGLTDELADANAKVDNLTAELVDANQTIADLIRQLEEALANKTKTVVVDGVEYPIEYVNGTATVDTNATAPELPSTVVVDGKEYPAEVVDGKLVVKTNATEPVVKERLGTVITAEDFTQYCCDYYAGERGGYFVGLLTDSNGNPLVNKTVQIGYNGLNFNRTTNETGHFALQIGLQNAGLYTFGMAYLDDNDYNASFLVRGITIVKKPTSIVAKNAKFKASKKTKKLTVKLKTIVGSAIDGKVYLKEGKKLTLKVNGVTYKAKTNAKGKATFKITKLNKKGKYKAKIKFAGDTYVYKKSSKKIKITVK